MSDSLIKTEAVEKRSVMLSVRLTNDDADSLRRDAEVVGLSVSEYIRSVLLSRNHLRTSAPVDRLPHSLTVVTGGVALRPRDAHLVPATKGPFVSALIPG